MNFQGFQFLADHQRSMYAAYGIIFMRERRQSQRGNDGDAFIVHIDLVDTAFIAIHRTLDETRQILSFCQFSVLVNARQTDEEHSDTPQLCDPTTLTSRKTIDNGARYISA